MPAPSGGGQQSAQGDHATSLFWMLFLICVAGIIIWWLKRQWFVLPVFWFREYEIIGIYYVLESWGLIASFCNTYLTILSAHLHISLSWLHLPEPNLDRVSRLYNYVTTTPVANVQFPAFVNINGQISTYMRFPATIVLSLMAVFIYFCRATSQLHRKYDMQKLKDAGSKNWPQITPVLSLNLIKEDIEKGPWAMSRLPLDYCKDHDLLATTLENDKTVWRLKTGPAYRVLALQLGPMWRGVKNTPIHVKALVVIFLARTLKEREVASRFLKQIAYSAASGNLDFLGVEEQLTKYEAVKPLKFLEQRHAYIGTLMASLLELARADGVLASSEFLWLKPVDRRLWYMLNSVGRATAVVEVAGLFSHWLAEKKLGRKMRTPLVKEAVNALDFTIKETLYVGESERWHTTSAV